MRLLELFVGVYLAVVSVECQNNVGEHLVIPGNPTAFIGSDVEFLCTAPVKEGAVVAWSKGPDGNEQPISDDTPGYEIGGMVTSGTSISSTLRILKVRVNSAGTYNCKYDGSYASATLTVTYEGVVEIIGNHVIKEGTDMNFTCEVLENNNPDVIWKKDNLQLPNDEMGQFEIKGTELIIKKAKLKRDHGNITCASTYNGTDVSAMITIGGSVRIKAPKTIKFTEGERARFECIAKYAEDYDPEPQFTWVIFNQTGNITLTESEGRFQISKSKWEKGSVLHMPDVVFDDAGNYTCIGRNNITTVEHTIQLSVRDRLAALWPFIGIMSEVIILIIIIFIHEKCTQGDDIGEEDEDEDQAEPIKEKEKISLDGEGDMRMRSNKP